MRFHQQLINAVKGRRVLEVQYDGCLLVIEPYIYGINLFDHCVLRCYQIDVDGPLVQPCIWKSLRAEEITFLRETGTVFRRARPGYSRETLPLKRVFARL